jgi:hypothetical protein
MLYRPLLVIHCHPSIVSSPVDARSLLSSFFGTFGWLLGVLRALFAHELPPSSRLGLAVQRITVSMVPPSWSRVERSVESQIRFVTASLDRRPGWLPLLWGALLIVLNTLNLRWQLRS